MRAALVPSFRRPSLFALLLLLPGCPGPVPVDDAGLDAALDAPGCAVASQCDDGLFCNGAETCEGGVCRGGAPPRCDDGIACTVDVCSEAARACRSDAPDLDGDGFGDATCATGTDCDDGDPDRFPGNLEVCDEAGHDEDCDATSLGDIDEDADGFVSATCCNDAACGDDCDDARASVSPDGTETCNNLDDDCSGVIDEGLRVAGFVDADRDGFGDDAMPRTACITDVGFAVEGGDCDDDPEGEGLLRTPGRLEVCDGLDNDCDPSVDEDAVAVDWFVDDDGDGFGSRASGAPERSCTPIAGRSLSDRDCDDTTSRFSPRAPELCDGLDQDCNGVADFPIAPGDLEDDDRDGVPDAACGAGARDCDDRAMSVGPGEVERCNGRDDDCDGSTDEGAASAVFFRDGDGDGYGAESGGLAVGCAPPAGYSARGGDCDDADAARAPGAAETCDGRDGDCDGTIDETATCALSGTCSLGACRDPMCTLPLDDCDLDFATGCETDLSGDPDHCGGCGLRCGDAGTDAPPSCVGGRCVLSCSPGRADCNGRSSDGCETDTTLDLRHCGGCGQTCAAPSGDVATCDAGACRIASCRAGAFRDCNGDPFDGCETRSLVCPTCPPGGLDCDGDAVCELLDADPDHCGACGRACGPGHACLAGSCDGVAELEIGAIHACVRYQGGGVACFGATTNGLLGGPTIAGTITMAAVHTDLEYPVDDAIALSVGHTTSCVVRADGSVWCWGENGQGIVGGGVASPLSMNRATRIVLPRAAVDVACSSDFACALLSDHTISCWGRNRFHVIDELAATTALLPPTPQALTGEPYPVQRFAAGREAYCFIDSVGTACVGNAPNPAETPSGTANYLPGLPPPSRLADIVVGGTAACVRDLDGQVFCWGFNGGGELGRGTTVPSYDNPGLATFFGPSRDVAAFNWAYCAASFDGSVRCVGDNQYRQSGNPSNFGLQSITPTALTFPAGTVLGRTSGSGNTSCAIEPSGRIWCWGSNDLGEAGSLPTGAILSPRVVTVVP